MLVCKSKTVAIAAFTDLRESGILLPGRQTAHVREAPKSQTGFEPDQDVGHSWGRSEVHGVFPGACDVFF